MGLDLTTGKQMLLTGQAPDEMHLATIRDNLIRLIEINPKEAQANFKNLIFPWMAGMLATLRIQDDQLVGAEEQQEILLCSNAEMIDVMKHKGIDLPNFQQIERDVRARIEARRLEEQLTRGAKRIILPEEGVE